MRIPIDVVQHAVLHPRRPAAIESLLGSRTECAPPAMHWGLWAHVAECQESGRRKAVRRNRRRGTSVGRTCSTGRDARRNAIAVGDACVDWVRLLHRDEVTVGRRVRGDLWGCFDSYSGVTSYVRPWFNVMRDLVPLFARGKQHEIYPSH
jgi:hypothetical protein